MTARISASARFFTCAVGRADGEGHERGDVRVPFVLSVG